MPASPLHASARATLASWTAPDPAQDTLRESYLGFLDAREDADRRTCAPGHLTASGVLLSADRKSTLLTLHPRVGAWLQLGGHLEDGDTDLAAAALREMREESGIEDIAIDPAPIELHCHAIQCKGYAVPTRHYDVRFVGVAEAGAREQISHESDDLRWFGLDALPDALERVARLIQRAVERAG